MNSLDFKKHREGILKLMDDNSLFICYANKDSEMLPEPNRNFYYATGIKENNDILVMKRVDDLLESYLFISPYDEFKAKWVGKSLSIEEAKEISGVSKILYLNQFDAFLLNNIKDSMNLYFDIDVTTSKHKSYLDDEIDFIKEKFPFVKLRQGRDLFKTLRTIKSESELDEMKKAIDITRRGILNILDHLRPGLYEYQIESYFDQAIKYYGATGYAFDTIAASGKNACCLHYMANKDMTNDNDLILFDLGASVNMYCADISRTFPLNGHFTARQRQIYDIVLRGQKEVFNHIKVGITTRELNQILVNFYAVQLKKIGLIKEDSEVSKYYFHGVSHHIGLDCHDLAEYTPLKAGSVISNEPGLYISEENIGIRIEDDILVTEEGPVNLSESIIKDPIEIEKYLNTRK